MLVCRVVCEWSLSPALSRPVRGEQLRQRLKTWLMPPALSAKNSVMRNMSDTCAPCARGKFPFCVPLCLPCRDGRCISWTLRQSIGVARPNMKFAGSSRFSAASQWLSSHSATKSMTISWAAQRSDGKCVQGCGTAAGLAATRNASSGTTRHERYETAAVGIEARRRSRCAGPRPHRRRPCPAFGRLRRQRRSTKFLRHMRVMCFSACFFGAYDSGSLSPHCSS